MKSQIKKISTLFMFVTVTVGCSHMSISQIQPAGKYAQMFASERPFMQIEHNSSSECATVSNKEIDMFGYEDKKDFAEKKMLVICSPISLVEQLPHRAVATNIVLSKTFEVRFISAEACKYMIVALAKTTPGFSYRC